MRAVILAGGAGMRLRPLTLNSPKPMVIVNGKPFLSYVIEHLQQCGIKDFVFCLGYMAEKVKEYFGDGTDSGVKIVYSIENEFLGTGGALKLAEAYLPEEFLVVNGDTYLPVDYQEIYADFKKKNKTGMMVVYDNQEWVAEPNILLGEEEVLAYFKKEDLRRGAEEIINLDKTAGADCRYVDAGSQFFKKEVLALIPSGRFVSLEMDVFPQLILKHQLSSFVVSQRYYDLGTSERLTLIKEVLK